MLKPVSSGRVTTVCVGEAHKFIKLVVGGQRRVAQNVDQVGCSKHIEFATHGQIREQAVHGSIEIDIGLTICLRTGIFLRVDKQEVLSPHTHVEPHSVKVGEVKIAVSSQRAVVVRIHVEVLEQQAAVLDSHGVVVETQANAIRLTDEVGRIEVHLAIDIRCRKRSTHSKRSLAVTLETDDVIRNESIDKRKWQTVQAELGIEITFAFRLIGAADGSHFLAVA